MPTPATGSNAPVHDCSFNDECAAITCPSTPDFTKTGTQTAEVTIRAQATVIGPEPCHEQTLELFRGQSVLVVGETADRWFIVIEGHPATSSNPASLRKIEHSGHSLSQTLTNIEPLPVLGIPDITYVSGDRGTTQVLLSREMTRALAETQSGALTALGLSLIHI